jgi:plastocyanin domain-containing protein
VGSAPVVTPSAAQLTAVPAVSDVQTVRMAVTYQGYVPNTLQVKKDVPVRWVIEAKEISRCTNEIVLHDYNISQKLKQGQEYVIEFTPTHTGVIRFSCWMQMVWGKFVVS